VCKSQFFNGKFPYITPLHNSVKQVVLQSYGYKMHSLQFKHIHFNGKPQVYNFFVQSLAETSEHVGVYISLIKPVLIQFAS